ncbi:hypothetical protein F5146DRAFT_1000721 [Armillaria mellea]|nr:hypothetical protein F5146DRAFT_1000721 [Armillaria mellea]
MADEEIVRGLGVVRMCQSITFGQEVEYIWVHIPIRKSWPYGLHQSSEQTMVGFEDLVHPSQSESSRVSLSPDSIQNRYLGELVLITEGILFIKSFSVGPNGYFNAFLICVGGAVMSLRVVAMHEASKKIFTLVCALLMGELISMVTVLSFSFRTIKALQQSQVHACIKTGVPHYYWTFYLFPMVLETVLFGLAVSVAFKHVRERGLLTGDIECAFIANAATAFYLTKRGVYDKGVFHIPWLQIPQGVSISITILVVSRLILNLQHVYYLPIRDHSLVSSIQWRGPSDEAGIRTTALKEIREELLQSTSTMCFTEAEGDVFVLPIRYWFLFASPRFLPFDGRPRLGAPPGQTVTLLPLYEFHQIRRVISCTLLAIVTPPISLRTNKKCFSRSYPRPAVLSDICEVFVIQKDTGRYLEPDLLTLGQAQECGDEKCKKMNEMVDWMKTISACVMVAVVSSYSRVCTTQDDKNIKVFVLQPIQSKYIVIIET